MLKYHYTYQITNTKLYKLYIGVRSSNIHPTKDIGIEYFSSSTDKAFIEDQKQNPQYYEYRVLGIFASRKLAVLNEIELHEIYDVGRNIKFYNKAKQKGIGFDAAGVKWTQARKEDQSLAMKKRWNNEEARKKQSEIQKRVQSTPEARKKKSLANVGKQRNLGKRWKIEDTTNYRLANIGNRNPQFGRTYTPYYNPLNFHVIRIYSDQENQTIPDGYIQGNGKKGIKTNRKLSQESIQKMSDSAKRRAKKC